ncbi:zinc-binding dehydrogenase [Candidatus Bathyarchaeota archaeon]|nr:MAG: zinc-binding dehydrogenase [Candidatus Bathyarchaeota archaeon]TMI44046.1 MAG: zinc-binding dehydrogenase [Candidatus Bathyarchaeota archaeon]
MKAVRFHEFGGPEKLRYEETPDPKIGPAEVLIKIRACALNHLDIWARGGTRSERIPLPHISGSDISGEITEVGDLVSGRSKGEKVLVAPGISCGVCDYCSNGWDSLCEFYKIIGYETQGGYAEYVAVPARNLLPIPDKLSFDQACSVPLVFLTAWHMLVTRAHLVPGETVLVWAAGSGVGSAAVQVAKLLGAKVIATVGNDTKREKAQRLGADFVLNHQTQDIPSEIKRITNGRKVNVVFDHIGEATWERSMKSMAPAGRLVNCGVTSGGKAEVDIRYVFVKQFSLMGSFMGGRGELLKVLGFFEDGKLKPVVDSIFPLAEAAKAQVKMEKSEHFGKIVLKV